MINEITQPAQLAVTEQDIDTIAGIFAKSEVSLPISFSGKQESWQLPVSEEFMEGVTAQRKRLRVRNLQMHKQSMDLEKASVFYGGGVFTPSRQTLSDGVYRIGCLRKHWKQNISYMRNQKKISDFRNHAWIHYYLRREPGEEVKVSSMDVFHLPEVFGRSGEYLERNTPLRENALLICLLIIAVTAWLICGIILPVMIVLWMVPTTGSLGWFMFNCLLFTAGIGIGCTWFTKKCTVWRKWRVDSRQVVASIRQKVWDFCVEKFISITNSRLKRLYYADTVEEVGDIISCDITGFLKDHANVVNCETLNFWFTGFREDGDYMYMDITQKVRLERDLGDRIVRSKQTIMLQLMKPIQGIMSEDLYSDWSVVKIETHEK